jgi:DNA-binding IclR family transcriptional regulator
MELWSTKRNARKFQNKSLERALQILETFSFDQEEQTLAEVCRKVVLAKSTCHRLVSTLMDCGFLSYDESSKRYSLGLKLFELGSVVHHSLSLRKIASPFLNDLLAKVANKAVALAVMREDEIVYMDRKEDVRNPIKFATTEVGRHRPPHFGMFGQLFMAYLPDGEVDRLLEKHPLLPITTKSIVNIGEFKQALLETRRRGYSLDEGGAFEGLSGVAVPVRDASGSVVGSVGCSFITASLDRKGLQALIDAVMETGRLISEQLGKMVLSRTVRERA